MASWLLPFPVRAVFVLVGPDIGFVGVPRATAVTAVVYYSAVIWYSLGMMNFHVFLHIAGLAPAAVLSEFKFRIAMLAENCSVHWSSHGSRARRSCGQ